MNALSPASAVLLANSTALSTPAPAAPDADLVAAAADYARLYGLFEATDMDAKPGTPAADVAAKEQEHLLTAMDGIVDRMGAMVAATPDGVVARAMTLGLHDPAFACAYDGADESHGAKLLGPLLRDAHALAMRPAADAALLDASARFCVAEVEWRAANEAAARTPDDDPGQAELEAKADRLSEAGEPDFDAVLSLPCTTLAGAQAIARAIAEEDQELLKDASDYRNERLMTRLVASLLAMPGSVPPPPPPGADAELLDLCTTFQRQYAEAYDDANESWEQDHAAQWETFNAIRPIQPQTETGHRAKAQVTLMTLEEVNGKLEDTATCPAGYFATVMLRDWLGRPA